MNEELTVFFYNELMNDPSIAENFSGPIWIYLNMVEAEAVAPYIVHAIVEGSYNREHSQVDGEWRVSVYTSEVSTRLCQHIVGQIKRKFANAYFVGLHGVPSVQTSLAPGSSFIPTGNIRVHRYDMTFNIRYSRSF